MVEADVVINNNNIDLSIEIEDHEEAKDYHLFDFQCDIMKQQVEQRQRAEAIMKIEYQRYQNRLRKRQDELIEITKYEIDLIEDAIEKTLVDKTCLHPIYPFFLLK